MNCTRDQTKSYHYDNKYLINAGILATEVIRKNLIDYSKEYTIVITSSTDAESVYDELDKNFEKQVSCSKYKIVRRVDITQIESEVNALVNNKSAILILDIVYHRWIIHMFQRMQCFDKANNIIIITNLDCKYYDFVCRNLIMRSKPNFSVVIHNGDIKTYSQFINMKKLTNLLEDNLAKYANQHED